MTDKSPDAFRTISEVAEELDLPQHVLRFWESKFPPVRPMKRGGGRRYYRPNDVDLLRGIRFLLYSEGYTIRGVQKIIKEQGVRFVANCWREDRDEHTDAADIEADDGNLDEVAEPAVSRHHGDDGPHLPLGSGLEGDFSGLELQPLRAALERLREAKMRLMDS